ncbi:hypothetical protein DFJ63DRAFT_25036 [Scheffersomyces coipomensis]|uniref:uncharacterized protein n=1 Tax=Scheffersomyces coipomensis TaxID=1788519 RepID=UPI00315DABC8
MNARNRLLMISSHLQELDESELLPEFPMLLRHERRLYDGKFHSKMSGTLRIIEKVRNSIHKSEDVRGEDSIQKFNSFAGGFIEHWKHIKQNKVESQPQSQIELYNSCIDRLRQLYNLDNGEEDSLAEHASIAINKKSKWESLKSILDKDIEEIRILYFSGDDEQVDNHNELNQIFHKPTIIKTVPVSEYKTILDDSDELNFDIIIVDSARSDAVEITDFITKSIPDTKIWLNVIDFLDETDIQELEVEYMFTSIDGVSILVSKHQKEEQEDNTDNEDQLSIEDLQQLMEQLPSV